ncbi:MULTISPECIES: hypothetical protein [Elizabethkingia]|nr:MULTISPECIES: hypothetical protein [Elizabethkingia]MDE5525252.1 hypothetical protein [Elizabethkingia meningoseptica]NHQ66946.1 hypothetical protein [Elizabethkingia miricola]NHQ70187.1 hypothetical protein [Elizabethkingia miricola]NHQ77037.1 hypothetical protein [Elizabethkingia miricola]UIO95072.1 hypothetical protein LYZ41_12810 [Elizabethkingia miricola]
MEKLYLKIVELLGTIPEIKYIDLDSGQLQEEKPPLAYPAVLVRINESREDVDNVFQIVTGNIQLLVIDKTFSETNNITPEAVRKKGLGYMALNTKIHSVLQGYQDSEFRSFTNTSKTDQQLRKGLKTIAQQWTTSWQENMYNSN